MFTPIPSPVHMTSDHAARACGVVQFFAYSTFRATSLGHRVWQAAATPRLLPWSKSALGSGSGISVVKVFDY